jgi:hypothetical protein
MQLAVDTEFAHAAGDQLRVLAAEVEDQDLVGVDVCRCGWRHGVSISLKA